MGGSGFFFEDMKFTELQTEYIPSAHDTHSFKAYEEIRDAVAKGRKHKSYLSAKQLAMAIFIGIKKFGNEVDAQEVAKELDELTRP